MNEAESKELKKILNERRQNVEQGSEGNYDAQNFDALNFDTSKSDNSNLNVEGNLKFQNSDSDDATPNKNSKTEARDYDKEPIVIKNYSIMHLLFYIIIAIIIPSIFIKILYNKGLMDLCEGA